MNKIILNLGRKKVNNNNNSSCQITYLHNLLLSIIVATPRKDLSDVIGKPDT